MKTKIIQFSNFIFLNSSHLMASALLFTLLVRIISLQNLDESGDSKYYMAHIKQLLSNIEPYHFNHWSARFAIIFPATIAYILTGGAAIGAYVVPVLFSLIVAYLIMKIAKLMNHIEFGFLAAILLAVYPSMIRSGSQILPAIFSMVYLLAALYFILLFLFEKKNILFVIVSAVFVFLAYGTHIINLFFVPGILLAILLNMKRPWKIIFLFCGALFLLFIAETTIYYFFTESSFGKMDVVRTFHKLYLGRIDVIHSSHLTENSTLKATTIFGLFSRFVRPGPFFVFFFVISIWYAVKCVRKKDYAMLSLFLPACAFLVIMLFALKSIIPLVPALPFNARYFDVAVPFLILFSSFFLASVSEERLSKVKRQIATTTVGMFMLLVTVIIFSSNIVHHPFFNMTYIDKLVDKTFADGIPQVYTRQDSANYCGYNEMSMSEKVKIPFYSFWGFRYPEYEMVEEHTRIEKNCDYVNAFFVDVDLRLSRVLAVMPDGTKVLLCVPKELAFSKDWDAYLAVPENPLLLTHRRPLVFEHITVADYINN